MCRATIFVLALIFAAPALAAAQQPCTTDARAVVNELYRHMLERPADGRSNYWVQQLQSGRTVRDLVREIAKSDEHIGRFWRQESGEDAPYSRAVATFYRHILAAQADVNTSRTLATQATRRGVDAVIDQIVDSPDYSQRFGDWDVPGSGGLEYCAPGRQAVSRNQDTDMAPRFRGMDRNNDGVIARAEWRGNQQAFENQDWNNDGVLSGEEIQAAGSGQAANRPARRVERFETLDANNNGRIEPREWTGTVAAFNRLDTNNDNVLSRAEMVGNAADEQAGVAVGGQARDLRFESLDANNNGRIEPREWNGTVDAFNRLDVNNDNAVTRAEMMANAATDQGAVGTSGQSREVRVESRVRWTDTGIDVRAGQTVGFDARGTVRLGPTENEVAGVDGTLSRRRDNGAPMANQAEGALIARIGNSPVFFVGDLNSVRAPATGRLYLGVNDGDLGNNSGDFQVVVSLQP